MGNNCVGPNALNGFVTQLLGTKGVEAALKPPPAKAEITDKDAGDQQQGGTTSNAKDDGSSNGEGNGDCGSEVKVVAPLSEERGKKCVKWALPDDDESVRVRKKDEGTVTVQCTPPLPVKISPEDLKVGNAESLESDKSNVEEEETKQAKEEKVEVVSVEPSEPVKTDVEEEETKREEKKKVQVVTAESSEAINSDVEEEETKQAKTDKVQVVTVESSEQGKPDVEDKEVKKAKTEKVKVVPVEPLEQGKPDVEEQEIKKAETEKVKVVTVEPSKQGKPDVEDKEIKKAEMEKVKVVTVESSEPVKPDVKEEETNQVETKKGKVLPMKRLRSDGLKSDNVLQRETRNIKEVYKLGRKLGQGQFGTTFYCLEKLTGKEFACKSIMKRKLTTEEDVEDVRREIQIMHHLAGHPNVISITDAFEDPVAVHVVMELCAGGELFDRIIRKGHYSEKKAAELARVIVGVVETCHSLGVMHRDLKPENFLFVNEKEEALLKAIDFGLSEFFKPGEIFTDLVGSPYYVAPEVLQKKYGQECDIWSSGVIIYILLSGVPPFWDETEQGIFEQILRGELDFESDPWPRISESAKDLLRKMLAKDPKKRLTAHDVLRHPWVRVDGVAPDKPLDSEVLTRLKQFSALNKIKKLAIRVIAESLSEEEITGLKEMFKAIDTDNSGQITYEELKAGLEKVGANLNESEINALMQSADIDNSGTIDYGEFLAATLHLNKVQKEDHLFGAFSYLDKDGSGFITQDELQQACKQFGLDEDHLEEMIREVDDDNDGRIDYNEFVRMMQDGPFGKIGLQDHDGTGFTEALKLG
ncbi:non-specific serine/threonine protein kinase [Ranunculus cassubicifolius]